MNLKAKKFFLITTAMCVFSGSEAFAAQKDYFEMSLEELTQVKIRSVSKKEEKANEASAAVFVITQEDIKRSGATSIPDVLRMAPGIQVAQIDSNKWAISSRGFNRQFSNKLLVLIDGRSVYTPLFSGVYWDVQDTMLEDIEKIEVIRGPGATVWGANAVNGVINIITKKAADTQGGLVSALAGNEERGTVSARYGGKISDKEYYRVYGKYLNRDESTNSANLDHNDDWSSSRSGFRYDVDANADEKITIQGDAYYGEKDVDLRLPRLTAPFAFTSPDQETFAGANILGKWTKRLEKDSEISFQGYIDYTGRDVTVLDQQIGTVDLDFQHTKKLDERNELVWGLGYRFVRDDLQGSQFLTYAPSSVNRNLFSSFIQDQITVIPEKVFLTVGSKFEHNDYTGFELQPSARISWVPESNQTIWASVSRAVRTPSRAEDGINALVQGFPAGFAAPGAPAGFVRQVGNPGVESEDMIAYEIGYRIQPSKKLSVDIATFFNDYTNLRTLELRSASVSGGALSVPLVVDNNAYGESYGFEVAGTYEINDKWRISPSYSFLVSNLHLKPGTRDTTTEIDEGRSPKNQFSIRSYYNFSKDVEFDNMLYYVDNLSKAGISNYIRYDARIAWKALDNLELSLVGQNLFDDNHPEFNENLFASPSQAGRSVYGKVTWLF